MWLDFGRASRQIEAMNDPVLVLGAGGFIGRHMVNGLAASGFTVVAGMRRPRGLPPNVGHRQVDAGDKASLAAALEGMGAVVNCVASRPEEMLAATRVLAEVAGQRRVVHLSSMSVYGNATGVVDEGSALTPVGDYGESKAESERVFLAHAKAGGEVIMLRPGCVHGPGSESWTARPARLLRAGRLGDLGAGGDGVCNLTAVTDLVTATAAALRLPEARGQAYNISDPAPRDWNTYFVSLAKAIGATPVTRIGDKRLKIEKLAAYPLKVAEIIGRKARLRLPDPVPPSLLRTFRQDITLDHRRADAELGFERMPPEKALAAAAMWFTSAA